jgi:hypothetical protein
MFVENARVRGWGLAPSVLSDDGADRVPTLAIPTVVNPVGAFAEPVGEDHGEGGGGSQ